MGGRDNDILVFKNIDPTNTFPADSATNGFNSGGELLIGTGSPQACKVGSIESSSLSIGYNGTNITVETSGGGIPDETLTGDSGGAVGADVNGNIDIQGVTVANDANGKPVFLQGTPGSNLLEVDVQVGAARTGAPSDANDAGLVSFDDTAFAVDANGYVTLVGGAGPAVDSFTTDVSGPVSPNASGVVGVTGTSIFSDGTTANTLTLNVQATSDTFLVGAGSNSTATELGPLTDGQLIIGATGAAPAAATLTAGTNVSITNSTNSVTINANTGAQEVSVTAIDDTDSPYTVLAADYYLSSNVTNGVLTIDLPDAPNTGRVVIVKDVAGNASNNNITVTTTGGVVNIDGATTFVMNTDYEAANFLFNGSSWEVH